MKRSISTLAALLIVAVAVPAIGQVTDDDVDRARRQVNEILDDSRDLNDEVQAAWSRQFALEREIADLEGSIEVAQVRIGETERRLEDMAVEMYMGSTSVATIQVLFSGDDQSYGVGLEYLSNVSSVDEDVVHQLRSFRTELGRHTERLAEASAEQEVVTAELEEKATELQADLVEAQGVYDELVARQAAEEEARRRAEERARQLAEEAARNATTTTVVAGTTTTVEDNSATTIPGDTTTTGPPPAPSSDGGTCPVAGAVHFSDSFGAPRSGGRAHQGVDMIAARNTPLVAIYPGTIRRMTTGNLSGLAIWLRTDGGDQFFYAHLESYGDISPGQ
ncbi:MAG: murein hydrolase activator EnvC family protein, partial [Acidimicrobiia bacterium]